MTIEFTAEQLAARVEFYGDRCWICGTPDWTAFDHVKPLNKGGPHMLSNLRPACSSCNRAKSDKWPLTAAVA
ncbi:HNH endonuclease [Gordonia phage Zipp]|uniref:HNH endonuclease n=1 Tax=Gordonia phage Zipp TaxID=2591212 RepID=A0A514DHW8_9CAUD|nr:HNH endonuclease [Gordonia phage Zipp]QDH93197.1 HNH endonuclease [Gordonia phage Zipp]